MTNLFGRSNKFDSSLDSNASVNDCTKADNSGHNNRYKNKNHRGKTRSHKPEVASSSLAGATIFYICYLIICIFTKLLLDCILSI